MSAYTPPNTNIIFERCPDNSVRVFKQIQSTEDGTSVTTEVCFIPAGDWNDLVTAMGSIAATGGVTAVDTAPEAVQAAVIPANNDPLVAGVADPAV